MNEQTDGKQPAQPQFSGELRPVEFSATTYRVTIAQGLTRRQVIDPAFWAVIAPRLKCYDTLQVVCEDGTLFAELLVIQCDRTYARVHVMRWEDLTTRDIALSQSPPATKELKDASQQEVIDLSNGYTIEYKGKNKKWCAIRKLDGAIVRDNEANKEAAMEWLTDFLKVTA